MTIDKRIQAMIDDGYPLEFFETVVSTSHEAITTAVDELMQEIYHKQQSAEKADSEKDELVRLAEKEKAPPRPSPDGISHVYFIGGQPGAGKSSAMTKVASREASRNGAVNVEMDAYREKHPNISELKEMIDKHYDDPKFADMSAEEITLRKSSDLVACTQQFADAVADQYKVTLFEKGYNIAIESTLRHASTVTKWATRFKEIDPQCSISVIMVGVSHDIAYEGTVSRAEQMRLCNERMAEELQKRGISASRVTRGLINPEYFDGVCSDLSESIDALAATENQDLIDGNVEIVDRSGKVLYDRNTEATKEKPVRAGEVEDSALYGAIAKEQEAAHRQKKAQDAEKGVKKYYGVEAYIKEHHDEAVAVFGDPEKAKEQLYVVADSYYGAKAALDDQSALTDAVTQAMVVQETNGKGI